MSKSKIISLSESLEPNFGLLQAFSLKFRSAKSKVKVIRCQWRCWTKN